MLGCQERFGTEDIAVICHSGFIANGYHLDNTKSALLVPDKNNIIGLDVYNGIVAQHRVVGGLYGCNRGIAIIEIAAFGKIDARGR